jgi:hydrogenase expression/formation protein HypE
MAAACKKAGVLVIAGDTKVVERGKGDGVYISTAGVGVIEDQDVKLSPDRIAAGDHVIINGTVGDHGIAILSKRENLSFATSLQSDSAPLHDLIGAVLAVCPNVKCMRDPTRGGVAAVTNEIARATGLGIVLDEGVVPIAKEVEGASELLGIDPLNVANEGKVVIFCAPEDSAKIVETMRQHPLGRRATVIGEVVEDAHHLVMLRTPFGGNRLLHWPAGEQLPRIC